MSASSAFGHEPSIIVRYGFSTERNSFYERIERLSDLIDFLAIYVELDAIQLRQLDAERRRANALSALAR